MLFVNFYLQNWALYLYDISLKIVFYFMLLMSDIAIQLGKWLWHGMWNEWLQKLFRQLKVYGIMQHWHAHVPVLPLFINVHSKKVAYIILKVTFYEDWLNQFINCASLKLLTKTNSSFMAGLLSHHCQHHATFWNNV